MDDQYTFENKTYKDTYRHTTSHILAQAMKRLYPEVKLAIGPAIEDGFYYDFDSPQPFTPEVLETTASTMTLMHRSTSRRKISTPSRPRCARSARKSCVSSVLSSRARKR